MEPETTLASSKGRYLHDIPPMEPLKRQSTESEDPSLQIRQEDCLNRLAELNETAVQAIQNEDVHSALDSLLKAEKTLLVRF